MTITDSELDRAARAVRARLERLLEFQVSEDSPYYMEVRSNQEKRERGWARRHDLGRVKGSDASTTERMGL